MNFIFEFELFQILAGFVYCKYNIWSSVTDKYIKQVSILMYAITLYKIQRERVSFATYSIGELAARSFDETSEKSI